MYRLLFSFSFEMRRLVFSPAIWPVHPSLSDIGSRKLAEGPAVLPHRCSACSALTRERMGRSPGASVHYGHTGSREGPRPWGPAVHVAFLTL